MDLILYNSKLFVFNQQQNTNGQYKTGDVETSVLSSTPIIYVKIIAE